jgi:uncharacterized protein (TIGR02118 family)
MNTKTISIIGLIVFAGFLFGFQQKTSTEKSPSKKGMIKVTILYANGDGKNFNMDYYSNKHMPMVAGLLGDSLKMYEIDKGIAGRAPGDPIPYLAIGYFYFNKLSEFQHSFAPHAEKIRQDIPNYTNIQPVIQISEVVY